MNKKNLAFLIVAEIIILFGFVFLLINWQKNNYFSPLSQNVSQAVISGNIDLNGFVNDTSTITIMAKKNIDSQFDIIVANLPAKDGAVWSWNGAVSNQQYDLKAVLYINGQKQTESDVTTLTAPAVEEILRLNSTYVDNSSITIPNAITGSIDLNGSIPNQSTISIFQKEKAAQDYQLIMSNISAVDQISWGWSGGKTGKIYQIKAILYNKGQNIGESMTVEIVAPASNEVLRINSKYTSPQPQSTKTSIWGKVNVNGQIPVGSMISIYKKSASDNDYVKVITGLGAADGVQWGWNEAMSGTSYLLKAVLTNNNIILGQSTELSITAPASNEIISIDIGTKPAKPINGMTIQCNSLANNVWVGTLNYQTVNNAQTYWIEVGTQPGGNDVVNAKVPTNNQSNQNFVVNNLTNNLTYYAQYAYANCNDCSDTAFSFFSNQLQFNCHPGPTATPQPQPTYTPYPTYTPVPTNIPQPTNTPVPASPTPKISKCNESCGGDGYECEDGLACISFGGIGSSVCRNSSCQEQTDCNCQ